MQCFLIDFEISASSVDKPFNLNNIKTNIGIPINIQYIYIEIKIKVIIKKESIGEIIFQRI